jgi:hypothetical protein
MIELKITGTTFHLVDTVTDKQFTLPPIPIHYSDSLRTWESLALFVEEAVANATFNAFNRGVDSTAEKTGDRYDEGYEDGYEDGRDSECRRRPSP